MKCDDMQYDISAYLDDALDLSSQATMFAHLGECGQCRVFLRRMLDLRAGLAAIPVPEVPPSLDRRVRRLRMKRTRPIKGPERGSARSGRRGFLSRSRPPRSSRWH